MSRDTVASSGTNSTVENLFLVFHFHCFPCELLFVSSFAYQQLFSNNLWLYQTSPKYLCLTLRTVIILRPRVMRGGSTMTDSAQAKSSDEEALEREEELEMNTRKLLLLTSISDYQ